MAKNVVLVFQMCVNSCLVEHNCAEETYYVIFILTSCMHSFIQRYRNMLLPSVCQEIRNLNPVGSLENNVSKGLVVF